MLNYLCSKPYPQTHNQQTTTAWLFNVVLPSPLLFLAERSERAFCISHLYAMPWTPGELEVDVMFLCADQGGMWESINLLRSSIFWSRSRGCVRWRVSSDTQFDFRPIARRLGCQEIAPRYVKDLTWEDSQVEVGPRAVAEARL